eukprot:41429-Chlamydomonas_euryale.AAC.1
MSNNNGDAGQPCRTPARTLRGREGKLHHNSDGVVRVEGGQQVDEFARDAVGTQCGPQRPWSMQSNAGR